MDYREELFKALTAGVDGVFRDKSIDALVEVCRAARKEGYNAGFENGNISDGTFDAKIKEAYENGANDAWALAYELEESPFDWHNGVDIKDIKQLTGAQALAKLKEYEAKSKESEAKLKEPVFKVGDRVRTLIDKDSTGVKLFPLGTIGEVVDVDGNAIEVKAYDEIWYYHVDSLELANDVFLVGDEVYLLDKNYLGVVTAVWEHCGVKVETLTQSGKLSCNDAPELHRTGRRFPEIANVLKQMQEGNE